MAEAISRGNRVSGPKVEFHFNAGPPSATGVEALSTPRQKRLAQALAQVTAGQLRLKLRGEAGYKPDTSGQHHRLAFCRSIGGVVLELAFISNPDDMKAYLAGEASLVPLLADVLQAFAKITK